VNENDITSIQTPQGPIELKKIGNDLFKKIRNLLPYGVVGVKSTDSDKLEYGLVMQCGEEEVFGIKLQPVDCDKEQAEIAMQANTILITDAIPRYMNHGYKGVLIPLPYLREKGDRFESGIALFVFPSLDGPETQEVNSFAGGFDNRFGKGCTAMLGAFIRALQASSKESGITLYPVIGMEPRPRMALGSLSFGYLIAGNQIVAIKPTITDRDMTWGILRGAGITEVELMPARPFAINASDLAISKPVYQ
jgi:hypothetical protein